MTGHVLVGYDGSASSRWALRWAALEAGRRAATLDVLAVVDHGPLETCAPAQMVRWWEAARARARQRASEAVSLAATTAPGVEVTAVADVGEPGALLVGASRRADLVVLGAGSRSGGRARRPGRVLQAVATNGHCPVIMIAQPNPHHAGPDRQVVVGVDGSRRAQQALDFAAASAAVTAAPLLVVCVWSPTVTPPGAAVRPQTPGRLTEPDAAREVAQAAVARVSGRFPQLDTSRIVVPGYPPAVLARHARGAGLLAVGRRGSGGESLVFGSVSQALMRAAPCPLAVVGMVGPIADRAPSAADRRGAGATSTSPVPAGASVVINLGTSRGDPASRRGSGSGTRRTSGPPVRGKPSVTT